MAHFRGMGFSLCFSLAASLSSSARRAGHDVRFFWWTVYREGDTPDACVDVAVALAEHANAAGALAGGGELEKRLTTCVVSIQQCQC
jgi:hypothetical protein